MTDDDKFPLMDIPYPANELAIQQMDFANVIELTLTSKNFKRFMNGVSLPVGKFIMDLAHERLWVFKMEDQPTPNILFETETINLENAHFCGNINGEEVIFQRVGYEIQTEHPLEDVCTHLLSFLNPINYLLNIKYYPSILNSFYWKITRKWKSLVVRFDYTDLISWEELKFIMEENDFSELSLSFPDQTEREIEDNMDAIRKLGSELHGKLKTIKNKEFTTTVVDFITLENILNSESKVIALYKLVSPFTSSQLNELLKEWKTGNKMTNLLNFVMCHYKQDVQLFTDSSAIVEGIDLHEEKPTHRTFVEIFEEEMDVFGNLGGMTIKRDTDGMLATIWITIDGFEFFIWHNDEE